MTSETKAPPVRLFYSYCHKDEKLRDKVETHLKPLSRLGLIENWSDRRIEVGHEWDPAIRENLKVAEIILLLVSPDFIASDYCWNEEMDRALRRHNEGTARVIPIILRPTDLKDVPFMKLKALPKDAKPVTKWANIDEALKDVAGGIREVAETMLKDVTRTVMSVRGAKKLPDATATAVSTARSAPEPPPYAPGLRRLIKSFLNGDDFDGFCSAHFPSVKQRFTSGMQQPQKLTILMEHAEHSKILQSLREEYPGEVSKGEHLLEPRQ